MNYYVPEMNLNNALSFSEKLNLCVPEDEMVFDFSRMSNFDPLPMMMMGAIIREYRKRYPSIIFRVAGTDTKGYAGNMGFFKYISTSLGMGKMPGEAKGSANYIPITKISVEELRLNEKNRGKLVSIGDLIERESGRLSSIVDRGNEELHKLLTYLIREILRNTPEHAKTDEMWICGQYWPTYELAEIAIIDEGIGVFESLKNNRSHKEYIKDNSNALRWALKAGISESFKPSMKQKSDDEWANSGFGLYMVNEICKLLHGSFCIISYDNYMLIDNHGIKEGTTSFKGTAIRMRVPSTKIRDAKAIISEIAMNGEREAKTIRNAFKKASTPSKGLMESINILSDE